MKTDAAWLKKRYLKRVQQLRADWEADLTCVKFLEAEEGVPPNITPFMFISGTLDSMEKSLSCLQ